MGIYFKEDFKSPIIVLAWLQMKGIIKLKMVIFTRYNARLHTTLAKGYKVVSIYDGPQLEACIYVVNQEQAFEGLFKWEFTIDDKAKLNMARIGEEITKVLERGTKQAFVKWRLGPCANY